MKPEGSALTNQQLFTTATGNDEMQALAMRKMTDYAAAHPTMSGDLLNQYYSKFTDPNRFVFVTNDLTVPPMTGGRRRRKSRKSRKSRKTLRRRK
jgi:hypothetical protein